MNRKRKQRGFTLIEVLLVLAILGMMAGIAIFAVGNIREGAKIDITKAVLKTVGNALDTYNLHIGHYPTQDEGGLNALLVKPTFSDEKIGANWRGPYLTEEPRDAWGNKFNYEQVTPGTPEAQKSLFKLWSNGPNLQDNQGSDDDIKNWSDATVGP
jgi:general secretion pathway protein G